MNRTFLALLFCGIRAFAADAPQTFGDGSYVAVEPMANLRDPLKPKARWFHENTLTISGADVTLNKVPAFTNKGEKGYSASDGGFYTYRGTLNLTDGQWYIELLLTESDYVGFRIDKEGKPIPPKPQQFTITRMKDGSILIDKVTYRRSKPK